METKSAVLGGLSALVAGAIAFSGFAIANADIQPAPAVTTVATTVAPEPAPEPVVSEPVVEPVVEPEPVAPVVAEPAPVVAEPVYVAPVPVYVAPVAEPVYVAPEPAQTFEAPPIVAPGVPNPIQNGAGPGGNVYVGK